MHWVFIFSRNVENNRFTGWIPNQLKNINLRWVYLTLSLAGNSFNCVLILTPLAFNMIENFIRKDGNSWSSGPAPPPPPGTPPATRRNRSHSSGGSPSSGGSSEGQKSGLSGGAIAGIIISVLVVGAVVAFFIVKRRSKRSSSDIERLDNQPLQPLKMTATQGRVLHYEIIICIFILSIFSCLNFSFIDSVISCSK